MTCNVVNKMSSTSHKVASAILFLNGSPDGMILANIYTGIVNTKANTVTPWDVIPI